MNQRAADSADTRDRIDRYLRESGLAARNARVVPLTGDAADRRYFRIRPADGPSIVLALHAGPLTLLHEQATALLSWLSVCSRRLTVGKLAEAMGLDYAHHPRAWTHRWRT